jgi:hypothetical protein
VFNTYYWIDPVRRIGGVFLTQLLPFLDPTALGAFEAFETAAYAALGQTGESGPASLAIQ